MLSFNRIRIIVAAVFLVGVGFAGGIRPALSDWRLIASGEYQADLVRQEVQQYLPLIASLPARGVVGYLQPHDWPSSDTQRRFYLAAYALTPRIVVMGTAPEFVIVVPDASVQGDDGATVSRDLRLADFALLRRFDNGLRVFRRIK